MKQIWLILGVFLVLPSWMSAQKGEKIQFTATASPMEVVEGGTLQLSFQLTGSINGQLRRPDFGAFRPTGGAQEMSGMQIVNGNVKAQHTWIYTLTAPAAGDYTIPSATIAAEGKAFQSDPLKIKVVKARAGANTGTTSVPENADKNLFITVETDRSRAFAGQQVIATVNVYTKYNVTGVDLVALPKTNKGYPTKELERYDMPVTTASVGGVNYTKRAIYACSFFPEESGELIINPAVANIAIEPPNFFAASRAIQLQSEPVKMEIMPLPKPAPNGFSGAVGQYRVEIKTDHDTAALGEAFICELNLRGNGNGRLFAPPSFPLPEGLETFDPVVKEDEVFENGKEQVHQQVLEYVISAKATGTFDCGPKVIWFDPDSSKYITFSPDLHLTVVPGDGTANTPTTANKKTSGPHLWQSPKFIGGLSLGLAALLTVLYFLFFNKKKPVAAPEQTPVYSAPSPTFAPVMPTAPTGMPKVDAPDFYAQLYAGIQRYFAARIPGGESEFSKETAVNWMETAGFSPEKTARTAYLIETCEQVLYAAQNADEERRELLQIYQSLVLTN